MYGIEAQDNMEAKKLIVVNLASHEDNIGE